MNIYHELTQWQAERKRLSSPATIGFVPTMGNLHPGHLSLAERCVKDNDIAVASIFVNPTQFNKPADFEHYPRTLKQDLNLLESAGITHCILPTEETLYADGFRFRVEETQASLVLEGEKRPGHFTGVLTVVMKLFQLVQPHRVYFGEKDYQQLCLIRDMVDAFFMGIKVIGCPTVRESSGLAYSSRNTRLSAKERELADQFAHAFHHTPSIDDTIQALTALGIDVEYIQEHEGRRFAAVNIGDIRLIDNVTISH